MRVCLCLCLHLLCLCLSTFVAILKPRPIFASVTGDLWVRMTKHGVFKMCVSGSQILYSGSGSSGHRVLALHLVPPAYILTSRPLRGLMYAWSFHCRLTRTSVSWLGVSGHFESESALQMHPETHGRSLTAQDRANPTTPCFAAA